MTRPPSGLSRRELLGAGAVLPMALAADYAAAQPAPAHDHAAMAEPPESLGFAVLETLTAAEMELLAAFCARLVPSDAAGAGAKEARAAQYIDRALAGPLASLRPNYAVGLAALDAHARTAHGQGFAQLGEETQDSVLRDLEAGRAGGFVPGSAAFFTLVRTHTIEGMFCDPFYGGNAGFVGWDMIGYPGLRMMAGPQDQRFAKPPTLRRSAYASGGFAR